MLKTRPVTVRLALRALAQRSLEGAPADLKQHWTDVETLESHLETVQGLPSKLLGQLMSDGKLLFDLLSPDVARGITAAEVSMLLLRIKYNAFALINSDGILLHTPTHTLTYCSRGRLGS
jgi:hypothetical protein